MRTNPLPTVLAALLLLAACGDADTTDTGGEPTDSASPTVSASPSASPTDSESPTSGSPSPSEPTATSAPPEPITTHVYYLIDTRTGFRLARETREVEDAEAAVEAMIAGPQDDDYATSWNPETEVLGVVQRGPVVTVDLSEEARRADAGSEVAARMVQQLVYTATEAAGPDARRVQLLIEGAPAGELWGAVSWTRPIARANPDRVRMFVQIDTPTEGETTSSPLVVEGEANAFEATVPWRVLRQDGTVVRRGFTTAREGMTFAPYSFTVRLKPGTYVVEVHEDDPSGGEGGTPMHDTKTVTIS